MNKVLEEFLASDGESRDIVVDLANKMGIVVQVAYLNSNELEKDFFALTIVNKKEQRIMINASKIKNAETRRFVLAYQLAEIIKLDREELYCMFELENLDMGIYELAKKIFDRCNSYNNVKLSSKKHIKEMKR